MESLLAQWKIIRAGNWNVRGAIRRRGFGNVSFFPPLSYLVSSLSNIQMFVYWEPKRSMVIYFFPHLSKAIECRNHTILREASRSRFFTNYIVNASDNSLTGWFTFSGPAGTRMATTCVPADHCGTLVPGWLAGKHPSVDEGLTRPLQA